VMICQPIACGFKTIYSGRQKGVLANIIPVGYRVVTCDLPGALHPFKFLPMP